MKYLFIRGINVYDTYLHIMYCKVKHCNYSTSVMPYYVRDEGRPPPWYAKGRYTVRKNPVISYADITFYF